MGVDVDCILSLNINNDIVYIIVICYNIHIVIDFHIIIQNISL